MQREGRVRGSSSHAPIRPALLHSQGWLGSSLPAERIPSLRPEIEKTTTSCSHKQARTHASGQARKRASTQAGKQARKRASKQASETGGHLAELGQVPEEPALLCLHSVNLGSRHRGLHLAQRGDGAAERSRAG